MGERLLIDCGEGTQRQLLRSDLGLIDLQEIFLTHFHADHFLGLPGMLKTFALRGRELPLTLYGPRGLDELYQSLRRIFGRLTFEVAVVELAADAVLPRDGYDAAHVPGTPWARRDRLRARRGGAPRAASTSKPPTRSGSRPAGSAARCSSGEPVTLADGRVVTPDEVLGEARPGRKVVLTGDTAPSDLVVEAAYGADVLVHEATFCEDEAERAAETEHSTALEAARVAKDANVRLLALTHSSSRYSGGDVEREARTVFADTVVPRDFDLIDVPFPERGSPELVKRGARLPRAEVPSGP